MMQWETIMSMGTALATAAYTAGALRQRVVDLERRMNAKEENFRLLQEALEEIRARVIAIDEWRKYTATAAPAGATCPLNVPPGAR
jgi:hypothetical protein